MTVARSEVFKLIHISHARQHNAQNKADGNVMIIVILVVTVATSMEVLISITNFAPQTSALFKHINTKNYDVSR